VASAQFLVFSFWFLVFGVPLAGNEARPTNSNKMLD
jgi:hypothetical protein